MSQNESTTFLVMDAKNLTLIDATRENLPWWPALSTEPMYTKPNFFVICSSSAITTRSVTQNWSMGKTPRKLQK